MKLAILADIHGNLPALEAVLADMQQQSVDGIIVAGDSVDRPQPLDTIRRLQAFDAWIIRGNRENYLLAYDRGDAPEYWRVSKQWMGLRWLYHQLDRDALDFLHALPEQQVITAGSTAPIRVVHGAPRGVTEILLPDGDPLAMEKYRQAGLMDVSYSRISLDRALRQFREPVLVCGHSHISWVQARGGRLVLNPGSVGAPINGDPRAQYALLTWQKGQWQTSHRAVAYDLERVREAYMDSGLLTTEGAYAEALLRCAETGHNVPGRLVAHFRKLAANAGFTAAGDIPDTIWEQAAATLDWEAAAREPG
jgi:predicted phosphodiesterase